MSMTLTINSTSFSSFLNEKSYDVNSAPLYESWTDANGIQHRNIYRQKISGTFTLEFWNATDYASLITALGGATDGYCAVSCHINNLGTDTTCNLFISMKPTFTKNRVGQILKWEAVCSVEER